MSELSKFKYLKDKVIEYRTKLNIPKDVTFGIEIEYENAIHDHISWYMEDISYFEKQYFGWTNTIEPDLFFEYENQEYNGEIRSPILNDRKIDWINLKTTVDLLKKHDAIITDRCGGHINVGAHILEGNFKYYRNFFLLWILYEKEIYKFSSGEFMEVRHPKPCSINKVGAILKENIKYIINSFDDEIFLVDYLSNCCQELLDKTHDLSLLKIVSDKFEEDNVIEFRVPNGTLREEIWQNYINFFIHFLISCKKELDVKKILYDIDHDNHNLIDLANFVFDKTIDKENFLIQSLKFNDIYNKRLKKHLYNFDL